MNLCNSVIVWYSYSLIKKIHQVIRRLRNISIFILAFLLLLALGVRLVVKVPSVQTWLVHRVAAWLSDELKVKVEVAAVDIRLFRSVGLKGVYIQDQQKDTLLYVPDLQLTVGQFSYKKQKVTVSSLVLEDARIWVKRYKSPREYNLDFIIDYFSGSGNDTSASPVWDVLVKAVELKNCHLTYQDLKHVDKDFGIDWDDIDLKALNVKISNLRPEADTVGLKVEHISFVERSGFKVNDFKSVVKLEPGHWSFQDLNIFTDRSDLHLQLDFNFNEIDDFTEFITNVRCRGDFAKSYIDFRDLTYFAQELRNVNRGLSLKGKVSGTVERFKGKNIELYYTDKTYFKGNVNMTGLPDFFETYMEIAVDDLGFNHKDLETVPAWPFDSLQQLSLPEEIKRLGDVHFKGNFNGFYNDFVAYGNATTALGFVSSDLNLKIGNLDRQTSYKGNVRLFDFDMGTLWKLPDLGKVSMKASLEGKGFELKNINANIEGAISKVYFRNYGYEQITLNGNFAQKLFTGEVVINDQHLDLDFAGEIDLRNKLPVFNFTSSIRKADLTDLKLMKRDKPATFSADVTISLVGSTIDNAQGTVQVEDVVYQEGEDVIKAERIFLETKIGDRRDLTLQSDFADVFIAGDYTLSALPQTLEYFIASYVPALTESNSNRPVNQEFTFKGELKRTNQLTKVFVPEIDFTRGTVFEGKINTNQNLLSVLVQAPKFKVEPVTFSQLHIDGHTDGMNFWFNTNVEEVKVSDSLKLNDVSFDGFTNRDTSSVLVNFAGEDTTKSMASFYINSAFLYTGYTAIKLMPRKLLLDGQSWTIDENNYVLADTTGLLLNEFNFINGIQELAFDGIIGKDSSAKLNIGFKDFEAAQVNDFLSIYNVNVGGLTNGSAEISGVFGKPALNADLNVLNIQWYGDTLGSADLKTVWDSKLDQVNVSAQVTRGGVKNINVEGTYYMLDKGDRLDFTAYLQKTYIKSFAHYLDGLVSDVTGIASGEVHLRGSSEKPELTGKIILQKVGFTIDYLQTSYNFSTEVDILKDRFQFKNVLLNDVKGNQAIANGFIRHNYLDNFYFDIDINATRTQVLNTGPADNDLYYGVAYASGNVSIKGYLDYINMIIGLRSEKGTKINIPLSNPEEVSRSGFITFINTGAPVIEEEDVPDFSGIDLSMIFDITPDATISLVFDEKIGDVIEGNGEGSIKMTISPSEDLKMYGDFTIESGKYLFTMQNVINKPFVIERGGTIRWSGDPYDATIDIAAKYSRRVSLYDLFQDSSLKSTVPVDLRLHLTDKLFNPNISFDIQVQNVDPNTETQIRRLINTEEEMYRQAIALLVTSRFTSPSEVTNKSGVSTTGAVGVNAYEMLSNQLSNWASQISNQVNVSLNYRPGDAITSEELQVAMSTTLFKDRVTIEGNVGNTGTSTSANNQNTSSLVGDFNVEVKASKDGHVRFKAFNRSNNNSLVNNVNSQYTQGVGVFYKVEFNTFDELVQKIFDIFRKKENKRMRPKEAVKPEETLPVGEQ